MYFVVELLLFVIFLLFHITNELEVLETAKKFEIVIPNKLIQEKIAVEAIVGDYAEIPCNVTAENEDANLNFLAWYRNDSSTAFYSRDLRGGNSNTVSPPDGRYQLITSPTGMDYLQIDRVLPSDAGVYQCVVEFALSPTHKTIVELIVIDPPHHLWVILENGTQVAKTSAGVNISQNIGPYYIGDTVNLLCVAFGGTPRTLLSWWSEQRLLKNTSSPLSEQRVRGDLLYGPLREEDHGRVLSCLANNNHRTLPLVIDIIIDMILPPDLITIRAKNLLPAQSDVSTGWLVGSAEVHDGNILLLQCRELGARPIPTLEWKIDGKDVPGLDPNITEEQTQRHVVSEIELKVTHKLDEAQVTCCTPANKRDGQDSVCAVPIFLTVLYPPVLKIFVDQEPDNGTLSMEKGSNLTLGCSFVANPNVNQLAWFHEEDLISESKDNNSILELKDLKESDAGEYVCAGTNSEGSTYSDPLNIDITYAYCEEDGVVEYGIRENESIDLTCKVKANPEATSFRWVIVNEEVNASTLRKYPNTTVETAESTMSYKRPNDSAYSTIFCWGVNGIPSQGTPCTFTVTDQTIPRPPIDCVATKSDGNIVLSCQEGHNGGLPQRFNMSVKSLSNEQIVTVVDFHPKFIIPEPKQHQYKIVISAFNDKGSSQPLEISQDEIVVDEPLSAVTNITTLSLALCGGVLLIALVACGLVLCAHDRGSRLDLPRAHSDPPLCAYSSEGDYPKMNCDVHGSDDGSECNVRRTESFRRAVSRYPSKNFDVRRTSSFHSTRYMNDVPDEAMKYDNTRHNTNCRVHSLQNINKKREMDMLCDHLVLHMPPEPNYNVPRPMNTFYTMPRKMRHKLTKELSDDRSEITQTSDGFSLPPPPDEFGTYRAGTRIKDIPKATPTYSTVRKNSTKESSKHQYNASPMNTGLPTISGQTSLYTYPDDHGHQVNTNPFDDDST